MSTSCRGRIVASFTVALVMAMTAIAQTPLGTGFTYQGRLSSGADAASGSHDLRFTLCGAATGVAVIAGPICIDSVDIVEGFFTVTLDFGSANVNLNGEARWLSIEVRADETAGNCSDGGYWLLDPRQPLTATPYALQTRGLFVDDVGRVGIGLTNPASMLDIAGAAKMTVNGGVGVDVTNASTLTGAMAIRGVETGTTGNTYGIFGVANSNTGTGVLGRAAASTGATIGVSGQNFSSTGYGVYGSAQAINGANYGVFGTSASPTGYGVYGESADNVAVRGAATAANGVNYGVYGSTASTNGRGVYAAATAATGSTFALYGLNTSSAGIAVYGNASANSGETYALYGTNSSTDGVGVFGRSTPTTGATIGVVGESRSISGWGVFGESTAATGQTIGVRGAVASNDGSAVTGWASSPTGTTYGIKGQSNSSQGKGVYGLGASFVGAPYGVYGQAYADGISVYAEGDLAASGSKAFRIDHPDDPANKYLLHYAAESPEVLNFYRGMVALDDSGEAVVELPAYFAKINKSPSYQLTAIGGAMPQLHVAGEIDDAALLAGERAEPQEAAPRCTFRIAGGAPGGKVSWRVEAVRNDRRMRAKVAVVEREKPTGERGKYQFPELYGQPPEMGMHFDHDGNELAPSVDSAEAPR